MAREKKLIWEGAHSYKPQHEIHKDDHISSLKDTIVTTLREVFAQHPTYTYVAKTSEEGPGPDFERTQIVITDVYTYDVKFLPAITLRLDSSRNFPVSFNQNSSPILIDGLPTDGSIGYLVGPDGKFVLDERGVMIPSFYEYAGGWENSVTLMISAEDTITREEVASYLGFVMQHLCRDLLYTRGVFVRSTSISGETETPYANDYIYQQGVSCEIYSEWHRRIPLPDVALEAMGFDIAYLNHWREIYGNDLFTVPGTNDNSLQAVTITDLAPYFSFTPVEVVGPQALNEWSLTSEGIAYLQRIYAWEQIEPYVIAPDFEQLLPEDFLLVLIIVPLEGSLSRAKMIALVDDLKARQNNSLARERLDEIKTNVIAREEAALTAIL